MPGGRKALRKIIFSAIYFLPFIFIVVFGSYFFLQDQLPQLPDNLRTINQQPPTEIFSHDGEVLKVIGDRSYVTLDLISPNFQKAIIAVEDSRFFDHHGVDPISIVRAFWINLKNQRIVQGGSTLTQQLAKNLFFDFDKSWIRKIKELFMAFQIEATFSKNDILEAYCNQVYLGHGNYGVEEASRKYFGKSAGDLTLLQAAVLAGIPKSPNNFNPAANRKRSLKRAKYILKRMVREKFISRVENIKALRSDLGLLKIKKKTSPNHYFIDFVIGHLEKKYGQQIIHFGGLRIFTTLDTEMQNLAHSAAKTHIRFLNSRMQEESINNPLETAVITIENKSGALRVMVGGLDYSRSRFNRSISNNRMPGSSFKPFVYMSAFENLGFHPATALVDEPVLMEIPGTSRWKPKNFNEIYKGRVVLKEALAKSLNTISVKLMYQLTPLKVIHTARKFGIRSDLKNNYSLALGTSGVSPLELASAYSVIANLGTYREPFFVSKIENREGDILFQHFTKDRQRFSKQSIYPLLDMMLGVVENGSGRVIRRLGFDHPSGGKTGTTDDFRDAWYTGFTKEYSASVWVGHDNNDPLIGPAGKGLTGSQAAAPVWASFMKRLLKGKKKQGFEVPNGIRFKYVNTHTGYFSAEPSTETVRVALRNGTHLPRKPAELIPNRTIKYSLIRTLAPQKPRDFIETDDDPPEMVMQSPPVTTANKIKLGSKQLETQIWFVLNLKNASLDQVDRVPISFLAEFLLKTKHVDFDEKSRLMKARKIVVDQLLKTVTSIDKPILNGMGLKELLVRSELRRIRLK